MNAYEAAALTADIGDKPSLAERDFEKREAAAVARQKLPVQLYDHTFGMGRLALSSALFGFGRGERQYVARQYSTFRGGDISYEGPELRQDDAAVLMGLVHATRNGLLADDIEFKPREFCRFIGWSGCSSDVPKLRESIERMQRALLRITFNNDRGGRFHLVGDFLWEGVERWTVRLSPTIRGLFIGGVTFLPVDKRSALTDGLQTWLAGFLWAQSDETSLGLDELQRFSGSTAAAKEFGRNVRDAMVKLQAVGVVSGYSFGRGRLKVER